MRLGWAGPVSTVAGFLERLASEADPAPVPSTAP